MTHPLITKLKNWWSPDDKENPDTPVPAPTPEPETPDTPEPPTVTPSFIPAVNYLRAFLILKAIPFKRLREEFLKLPLKQIAWCIGFVIWAYMSYAIVIRLFVK